MEKILFRCSVYEFKKTTDDFQKMKDSASTKIFNIVLSHKRQEKATQRRLPLANDDDFSELCKHKRCILNCILK